MEDADTIYDELGIPTVINAVGTRSQVSGASMRPEAIEAMAAAAERPVYMADLQARASDLIADVTDADAGLVTAGAASGLTLAAAACIARDDFGVMSRLPDTTGVPSEIVIPRAHRCKYDVAFRASGATLVGVGPVSHHPVEGGVDTVEPWRIDAAITGDTAAVAYLARPYHKLRLRDVAAIAHDNGVPVIVDAADMTLPPESMRRFVEQGADLVSFSGGKTIRGPQSTGILAGDRDLVRSAALQQIPDGYHDAVWSPPQDYLSTEDLPGVPPDGIGRPMKVANEEIVGLIKALESFLAEDHDAMLDAWTDRAEHVAARLADDDRLEVNLTSEGDHDHTSPKVVVALRENCGIEAATLVKRLRNERPRVWIGENRLHRNETSIDPKCLTDEEAAYVVERLEAHLE